MQVNMKNRVKPTRKILEIQRKIEIYKEKLQGGLPLRHHMFLIVYFP